MCKEKLEEVDKKGPELQEKIRKEKKSDGSKARNDERNNQPRNLNQTKNMKHQNLEEGRFASQNSSTQQNAIEETNQEEQENQLRLKQNANTIIEEGCNEKCEHQNHSQPFMDAYHPDNNEFLKDKEEMEHFLSIVCSYFNYRVDSLKEVARVERGYAAIKDNAKYLKNDYSIKIQNQKQAVERNAQFLDKVAESYRALAFKRDPKTNLEYIPPNCINNRDVQKMRSTLKQLIRDWSEEGKTERDSCYKPVWEEFIKHFPTNRDNNGNRVRVLFPGCGLARIAFDFAKAGYGAQGNEVSYHMLLASNFILNSIDRKKQFSIQPFIHSFCNQFKESDPFRIYEIPDINPSQEMDPDLNDDFSMAAGEFNLIYKQQKEEWHSVCTVFFIDTANDIIEYIKTIHHTLKPGGVWINLGPLLYHFADSQNQNSIELSWEELQHVIQKVGFKLIIHPQIQTQYASDPFETMMKVQYTCIFFTAIKI